MSASKAVFVGVSLGYNVIILKGMRRIFSFCQLLVTNQLIYLGCLNSWVVSPNALFSCMLSYALGSEVKPWWWRILFWTQAQHLCFLCDSIWFIWFDAIICLSNLSWELGFRKLKINKIYFKKNQTKYWLLSARLDHVSRRLVNSLVGSFM